MLFKLHFTKQHCTKRSKRKSFGLCCMV